MFGLHAALMDLAARRALLAQTRLFGDLPASTLDAVVQSTHEQKVAAGQMLCEEGEPSRFMFVLADGTLQALKRTDHGFAVLRDLCSGDLGGLTSMTVAKSRSASLRAVTPVTVLVIPKPRFVQLMREHQPLTEALIATLSEKVRDKTSEVAHLIQAQNEGPRRCVAVFDAKPYDRRALTAVADDEVDFAFFEARLQPHTAKLAFGYRVVCPFVNDDLGAETIARLASGGVELIAMRCAGYNNVDLQAAKANGLRVVRVPAYSPYAVAEHTAALLFSLNRRIHRAYHRVREGNFSLNGLVGIDLHGRTAGIVGLGKIGRCFADIVRGIGMRVLAFDPYPDAAYVEQSGIDMVDLDTCLHQADVVSLHTPLSSETYHLIDGKRIQAMKRGVIILNTSRGGLIDAAALVEGLKSEHIGGAGLDVYEEESEYFFEDHSDSVIADDLLARLMTFNNVVITSHQAFLTDEALHNIATTTRDNVAQMLRGESLTNEVKIDS